MARRTGPGTGTSALLNAITNENGVAPTVEVLTGTAWDGTGPYAPLGCRDCSIDHGSPNLKTGYWVSGATDILSTAIGPFYAISGVLTAQPVNLIVNGSFEAPALAVGACGGFPAGWSGGTGLFLCNGVAIQNVVGNQSLLLQGAAPCPPR